MRPILWFALGAITFPVVLCLAGFLYMKTSANGFSARAKPMGVEKFAAVQARLMALPPGARSKQNPVPNSSEVIAEGKAHWADHCATCHANNGSGKTEFGQSMYPPSPDMRKQETQNLTDGELFYMIENGIRLSGMPAWSTGTPEGQTASWKLVHFIRHLPVLSPEEISAMEKLNPKTPDEFEEEKQEEQFLKGLPSNPLTTQHQH